MAKEVAVIFADGCGEVEGLTVVDVLRRLEIPTKMVGLTDRQVMGAHQIALTCDAVVSDDLLTADVVAFPGGRGGAERLRDHEALKSIMVQRQNDGKWNAAMCAAPIAFARYGLFKDADFTCFPGFDQVILSEEPSARFHEDITVVDDQRHLITSRGPATAMAFAYEIAEQLGVDTQELQHAMLYDYLQAEFQQK